MVLNTLYKKTKLQISDGIILLALVENGTEPKTLNLREILYHYLEHQKDVIVRRTRYDLNKTEEKAHILAGLVLALANVDEVIRLIKASADRNEAMVGLTSAFELDEKQAIAILEMRLQRLTSLEVEKLKAELEQLRETIAAHKDIHATEYRVMEIIRTDLVAIKEKYTSPRKTEISVDYDSIEDEDLIDREDVVITITHGGYIKRLPVDEYKAQGRGGRGITGHRPKDEDYVDKMFVCCTHDPILLFSSKGKVYSIKGYEIPEANRTARGRAVVNIVQLEQDEKIEAVLPVLADGTGYLVMATEKGLIKKTHTDEFKRIARNGKIAIKLQENDRLIGVRFTTGENEILIASRGGKCIRFSEADVRPTGRGTQGVKAITLAKDDIVVDMLVIDPTRDLFPLTSLGYGKRSKVEDYRLQSRGGKGIMAGTFNEKTGYLVNLKDVTDEDDIMIITTGGTIIRMHADSISCIGRSTRGVRVMNVKDSEVATVDITERDDEAEVEAPEETAADLSPEELAGDNEPEEIEETVVLDDEETDEEVGEEDADETPDEE